MGDAPELKPCPFCGGKADFESVGMNSRTVWYRVMCSTGCCAGSAPHETCDEAAIAWNTRADTITALEEENKRLREALTKAAEYHREEAALCDELCNDLGRVHHTGQMNKYLGVLNQNKEKVDK